MYGTANVFRGNYATMHATHQIDWTWVGPTTGHLFWLFVMICEDLSATLYRYSMNNLDDMCYTISHNVVARFHKGTVSMLSPRSFPSSSCVLQTTALVSTVGTVGAASLATQKRNKKFSRHLLEGALTMASKSQPGRSPRAGHIERG